MGYASYDTPLGEAGYAVEDTCPYPVEGKPCAEKIDRGLGYLCGDQPGRPTEEGCGRWFCGSHLYGGRSHGLQQCPDCHARSDQEEESG